MPHRKSDSSFPSTTATLSDDKQKLNLKGQPVKGNHSGMNTVGLSPIPVSQLQRTLSSQTSNTDLPEQTKQDDLQTPSTYKQPIPGKAANTGGESSLMKMLYPRLNVKKEKALELLGSVSLSENVRPMSKKIWRHLARDAQAVKTEELKETDTVIALMGPTGSGKSSFISMVAGTDQGVGHDLRSCTANIKTVRVRVPDDNIEVVLVDTPGFDDTTKSDYEILQIISEWIKQVGYKNILLDGILYLHRISDNRMAGTPLRNLEVFEKICGPKACSRVMMMTTMWDEVENEETGARREEELTSTFWQPMISRGSAVVRYLNTPESAWGILERFLEASKERLAPVQAIQLQRETVKQQKALNRTDAGQELYNRIDEIDKKRRSLMRTLKKQMDKRGADEEIVDILRKQYEALEKEREGALGELRNLKVSVPQRYLKTVAMKTRYR